MSECICRRSQPPILAEVDAHPPAGVGARPRVGALAADHIVELAAVAQVTHADHHLVAVVRVAEGHCSTLKVTQINYTVISH